MLSTTSSATISYSYPKLCITYIALFIVWALYRRFFHTSIWIEETVIKGVIFSLPLLVLPLVSRRKLKALGISRANFLPSVFLGVFLGLLLGFSGQLGNYLRHHGVFFNSFGASPAAIGAFIVLSLITAFWEQLLFTGYFLPQFGKLVKNEVLQVVVTGLLFSLIHLPAFLFVQRLTLSQVLLSISLLFTLGVSCAILRLREKNLIAPVMAHALWGITIFLFR